MKLPFRRQYFRMATRALQEGRLAWLAKSGARVATIPLSDRLDRPLAGPVMVNLVPTYRCNNACFMCDLPKPWLYEPRGGRELDTDALKRIIDDVASLGTLGLSFTGGEPTVRPDCFELLRYGREVGLFSHLNTNGYNLHRPGRVEQLLETGVESMNISLDGARAETHNRLRGVALGFERIAKATELILRARRGNKPALSYTFVIGPDNFRELPDFVELARRRGVDSVSFMPLNACYEGATPASEETLREMDRAVDELRELKARSSGDFLDNSDAYLSLFSKAFRARPSPLKCYVGYHNLIIDCFANVYSCVLMYENGEASGNLATTSLRKLWHSREYQERRRELTKCKACFWNCHTEINLLYQRPG